MDGPVVPTIISPQQAADALGIAIDELARNVQHATEERLSKLAGEIRSFDCTTIEEFDDHVAGTRRLFETSIACWAAYEAASAEDGN